MQPGVEPFSIPGSSLQLQSTLRQLEHHTLTLSLQENTYKAIHLFEAYPLLPGVLLAGGEQFVGMLSRRRFYEFMSRPFSLELFPQRSLATFWDMASVPPLVLSADTPIPVAARQALQRSPEARYEPIVVALSDRQHGLIDITELLLAQVQIQELSMAALQQSQAALVAEKELAQTTLQSIGDGIVTTNAAGYIDNMNPVAERLSGWTLAQAQGRAIADIFHVLDETTHQPLPDPVQQVAQRQVRLPNQVALLVIAHSGEQRTIDYSVAPILNDDSELLGMVLVFRDVSQQRAMAKRLQWQANHDSLTGLKNRTALEKCLVQGKARGLLETANRSVHTLCYLDLDRFKIVNDTCGHRAGDELLRQIALLMRNVLREEDLLARLGGDEFGILLQDCPLAEGLAIAERIHRAIQTFRFVWEGYSFSVGVSIGLTLVDGTVAVSEVLRQADSACYLAKHWGRNQICCYPELQATETTPPTLCWVNRITTALKTDRFELFQQAVVATAALPQRQLLYRELLLRLTDDEPTPLTPTAFMATAERYNLMPDIDAWVIWTLCREYAALNPSGERSPFAINLSGASLNNPKLIDVIAAAFEQHDVNPAQICFEITETTAITNLTRAHNLVQTLKQWGCRVALDDFGGGMSSFSYLRSLPVDYLKIDGSLICDIAQDTVARAMVAAINQVGHEMGLATIAEWVEDEATLATLQALQVDYVQGFFIHVPEPLQG